MLDNDRRELLQWVAMGMGMGKSAEQPCQDTQYLMSKLVTTTHVFTKSVPSIESCHNIHKTLIPISRLNDESSESAQARSRSAPCEI